MKRLPFVQVDVFTDRPFAGNPLAIFPEAEGLTAVQMQAVASEMNLSETTFVLPPEGGGDARVRIFTPMLELPFAGHPSVGTAWELVRRRLVDVSEPMTRVVLELGVGPTPVDVAVRHGEPVSATVHQRPPAFHAPAPRGSAVRPHLLDGGPDQPGSDGRAPQSRLPDVSGVAGRRPRKALPEGSRMSIAAQIPAPRLLRATG